MNEDLSEILDEYLIGIRLRDTVPADDYKLVGDLVLHVGDVVVVETQTATALGEVRRPRRAIPEFRRDRLYRRVVGLAPEDEAREYRDQRRREEAAIVTSGRLARSRGLAMKVVDVEMPTGQRRVTVYFSSEERVDFRDLVRDLAREFRARIEMRQIGARDTTRVLDGIGPCGRQLCCSSHLRKFEPISVKMAKAQDMPLTDSRLLGNCGRLKCCLLYEFSTYQELRSYLPRVNTPCEASCGGGGCMTGKVRSLRVLKQSVVVGFPDGTEAEVPLSELTWEGKRRKVVGEDVQFKQCCARSYKDDGNGEDHPLGLLALHRAGHPSVAVELSEHDTAKKGDFYQSVNRERERRRPCIIRAKKTREISVERDDDPNEREPACPVRREAAIGKEIEDEDSGLGQEL